MRGWHLRLNKDRWSVKEVYATPTVVTSITLIL
jgi:hypothetical protein